MEFDFTKLKNVYTTTLESLDKSLAFDLKVGRGRFLLMMFLSEEDKESKDINIDDKIKTLRDNRNVIRTLNVIDEANKTVLIGDRKLSVGTPQDKTLRKLYTYTNSSVEDINELIALLKKMNMTVARTTEENRYKEVNIRRIIEKLS